MYLINVYFPEFSERIPVKFEKGNNGLYCFYSDDNRINGINDNLLMDNRRGITEAILKEDTQKESYRYTILALAQAVNKLESRI